MPIIKLTTEIMAPLEICFDLARSIDLHMCSTRQTGERAIAGVLTGLIGPGEWVTWRAKHFGLWLTLTSEITQFEPFDHFRDSMTKGAFERFDHDHLFEYKDGMTIMRDVFDYTSPFGVVGKLADEIFLKEYMAALLNKRNLEIKGAAENNPYEFLPPRF